MLKLAILHNTLSGQVNKDDVVGKMKVVWVSTNLQELTAKLPTMQPDAIAVDLETLGENPIAQLAELKKQSNTATILVIYAFAKWSFVEQLRNEGYRVVKAPISMRVLNANLLDLIVKNLSKSSQPSVQPVVAIKPKRYSKKQLGKLQEIRSIVDCECPNHVADIVLSLGMFEDYSENCKNKNAADAQIHRMLYEKTAKARTIMEEALEKLCEHEKIDLGS